MDVTLFKTLNHVVCMFLSPTHAVSGVAWMGESVLAQLFLKAECVTTMARGSGGHDRSSFFDRGQM